jgi:Tfp pilus assembly PilM family ATPase
MTRVLAVDWDSSEVRCVLASTVGKQLTVQMAASVALGGPPEADPPQAPDVGGVLRTVLAGQKLGRAITVVGLDRARVEMLNFTLPPATNAELPMLVFNQAAREAPNLAEDDVLDFVPLSEDPAAPRPVTVAVLSAAHRRQVEEICAAAGLKPARIVLRPLAAASLFLQTAAPAERSCLLVNVLAEEVDLTVILDGWAVLLRTVRVPQDAGEEEAARHLVAEISRTMVVAQHHPDGSPTERVYLFGGPDEHQVLVDQMAADLSVPVTVVDPFEGLDGWGIEAPGNAGRFASLLGMALDEACATHAVDFLHPRRPPRAPSRRTAALLASGLLALLALGAGSAYWDAFQRLQTAGRTLTRQRKELDEALTRGREQAQLFEIVRDWTASEVVWLDELRELSQRLPSSRDLLVQRMTISSGRSGEGVIELQGVVRDAAVVAQIDRDLHDDYHAVSSKRVGDYPQGNEYSWLFERTITVAPRDKNLYRADKQKEEGGKEPAEAGPAKDESQVTKEPPTAK